MADRVYCAGYGSLVHKEWAEASVPSLQEFALYHLKGYRRVFGKVHPYCIFRGEANFDTLEVAACFIEPAADSELIVSGFSIPSADLQELKFRECDYAMAQVPLSPRETTAPVNAYVFVGYDSDAQMPESFSETYKHWPWMQEKYEGAIYRRDILPSQTYLRRCLLAHKQQGPEVLDNFLDCSYLADRKTSIRTHLLRLNWDIESLEPFDMPQMPENKQTG